MSAKEETDRLLEHGRVGFEPPPGARERVLAKVIAVGGAPPASTPTGGGLGGASGLTKAILIVSGIGLLGALAGVGLFQRAERNAPPALSAFAAPRFEEPPSAESPAQTAEPAPSSTAQPRVAPSAPGPAARPHASASSADSLAEEIGLLRDAQAALRGGNASRALALLDQHAARYPKSAFGQERTATRIQALCRLGRTSEASALYSRLKSAAPSSPYVSALPRSCPALVDAP